MRPDAARSGACDGGVDPASPPPRAAALLQHAQVVPGDVGHAVVVPAEAERRVGVRLAEGVLEAEGELRSPGVLAVGAVGLQGAGDGLLAGSDPWDRVDVDARVELDTGALGDAVARA